ncbi:MAG: LysE family transporter [Bacillota bacterium]|nr:LysE family transporter [Bacillota bacterium]
MIQLFFTSVVIGYSGALMPGSLLTYTIDKSIKSGVKSGLLISLGHSVLEFFLVILLLFGIGKYLGTSAAKTAIGIVGGGFLSYLGIRMVRDAILNRLELNIEESHDTSGNKSLLLGGALISASNPYFIFWWAVVGLGLILNSYKSFGILGVLVFYIGHIFTDISWYTFISYIVAKTRKLINIRIYRVVIILLGGFMVFFGLSFLYGALKPVLTGLF